MSKLYVDEKDVLVVGWLSGKKLSIDNTYMGDGMLRVNCSEPFPVGKYIHCPWMSNKLFQVTESVARYPTKGVFKGDYYPGICYPPDDWLLADKANAYTEDLRVTVYTNFGIKKT